MSFQLEAARLLRGAGRVAHVVWEPPRGHLGLDEGQHLVLERRGVEALRSLQTGRQARRSGLVKAIRKSNGRG